MRAKLTRVALVATLVVVALGATGCVNESPIASVNVPGTMVVNFPTLPPPPYNPFDPQGGYVVCVATHTAVRVTGIVDANGIGISFNGSLVPTVSDGTGAYLTDAWGAGCAQFRYDATRAQAEFGSDVTVTFALAGP